MTESEKIAITAVGVIAPGAIGMEQFEAMLRRGVSTAREITRFDTAGLRSHCGALVENFRPKDFIAPMKLRRMNGLSRMALAAARLTMQDRALDQLPYSSGEIGVSMGTAFGPVQTSVEYLNEYVEKGAGLAPPQLFAESVANAPGSHIAIDLGFQGFNVTFTQRESSVCVALMYAASQIGKGAARAAFCGGVEELNETLYSVLDRIGALAHQKGNTAEQAHPFDRRRNGMMVGEGSGIVLLEPAGSLGEREPYALVSGFGIGKDVTASISDWGTGFQAGALVMRRAIADAGIELTDIDAVFASANSSVQGDHLEANSLQSLFGSAIPPVVATKGYFGEYAGAGSHQLISAVIALKRQWVPRSVGFESGEGAVDNAIVRSARDLPLRHILLNSFSAGGGLMSVVLSRCDR